MPANQNMSEEDQQQNLDATKEMLEYWVQFNYNQFSGNTQAIVSLQPSLEEFKTLAHLIPKIKLTDPEVRKLTLEAFQTRLEAAMAVAKDIYDRFGLNARTLGEE